MINKIAACIILYNPDDLVFSNIATYLDFADTLYVVDNSEVYSDNLLNALNNVNKVTYINNQGNLGIAKALNIACKAAISNGYQWLLTMDQDSSFSEDGIREYFEAFDLADKTITGLFTPYQIKIGVNEEELQIVMTSGNIANLEAYSKVGGFNDNLFIDEVDHDYCLRILSAGYAIRRLNSQMNHALGQHKILVAFNKKLVISVHSPIRLYYIIRNNLYMFKTYKTQYPKLMRKRKRVLLKAIFNNIFFDMVQAPKKIYYMYKGMSDYYGDKYGKFEKR